MVCETAGNWVEARVRQEALLRLLAVEYWHSFALACETAVATYSLHFPGAARFEHVNSHAVAIHLRSRSGSGPVDRTRTLTALVHPGKPAIDVKVDGKPRVRVKVVEEAGIGLGSVDGVARLPEDLAQVVLEPHLFPESE